MIVPTLRFNEFNSEWKKKKICEILQKITKPVDVELGAMYKQIGIRSHGKGIFHKELVSGASLGNKRVFWLDEDLFILNIVFAWEQAVAKTTSKEKGMVASHRFPMFRPKANQCTTDFIFQFFLTNKGKLLLGLASPGGAGRNKTLGQKNFENLSLNVPCLPEQLKIARFLTLVDEKITQLENKYDLLNQYKSGLIQQIFSRKMHFKDDDGSAFSDWEETSLDKLLKEHKTRNLNGNVTEVFSVAKNNGVINQIEHLGRSYASKETSNYKVAFPNDLIYTKSPTSDFPFGIVKQNRLERTGVVSVLYGVFTPKNKHVGLLLDYYFSNWKNTYNYLNPLAKKGAKNTINISNDAFLNGAKINLPSSIKEQIKIANFFAAIDHKIQSTKAQLDCMKQYKQGLLQQMFV